MWSGALNRWVSAILCVCAVAALAKSAQVIYVDDDAPAGGSGVSWTDACQYLQDALAIAAVADKPVEIRVAQGVYKPDQGVGITPGDQTATFQLLNGVTIHGGYAGTSAQDPNAWDPEQCETVLSGDLNGDDVEVNDLSDFFRLHDEPTRADNSLHVVTAMGTDETAMLDGLVITAGCAFYSATAESTGVLSGGGMLCESATPTILRCQFRRNFASDRGGGVSNLNGGPVFLNCLFHHNIARLEGGALANLNSTISVKGCAFERNEGGMVGAVYNAVGSVANLEDCTFEGNRANSSGNGGAISSRGDLMLTHCVFRQNSATSTGGAVCAEGGTLLVSRCSFSENTVDPESRIPGNGGAICCTWNAVAVIEESTFDENASPNGGAIHGSQSYARIVGCRFTNNTATRPIVGGLSFGGGGAIMASVLASMKLIRCDLQGNLAFDGGGAIRAEHAARLALVNCVLAGNRATRGGGICAPQVGSGSLNLDNCTLASNVAVDGSTLTGWGVLEHCIVWDGNASAFDSDATITAVYCDIQGGYPGQGNIDVEPLFVRPGYWADANDPNAPSLPDDPNAVWVAGDYHLQSQAGHWDCDGEQWIADAMTSPCIDAGDMGTPTGDEPFPNGGILNLGAYGATMEASKSYFGEPVCQIQIPGDINGDCKVDSFDALLAAQDWRVSGTPAANQPPTIVITQPADGAVIEVSPSNPSILIVADASDADGSVVQVGFSVERKTEDSLRRAFSGDTDGSDGWQWNWVLLNAAHPYSPGSYTITAYAIDDDCEIGFAPEVHITLIVAE
ncbi:MAG: Ig-like domain-containing protein [Phycisphaerales bacterium]